jgi:mono/diheme cytochrome c family protein
MRWKVRHLALWIVAFAFCGGLSAEVLAGAAAGSEEGGRALYARWCAHCHGAEADGRGRDAALFAEPPPSLRGTLVLVRYTDAELNAWIREGKQPQLGLRPEALREQSRRTEVIYRYVKGFPAVRWQLADEGREIYAARCLSFHDDYGGVQPRLPIAVAAPPRDLSERAFQESVSDEELGRLVRHEREGMPILEPPPTDEQVRRLVAFVRLLSPGYELYDRFCQGCHGTRGEGHPDAPPGSGIPAFAFDDAYFRRRDADWVLDRVWHMLRDAKARMPHFAVTLGEDEVRSALEYLRSLPPRAESDPK